MKTSTWKAMGIALLLAPAVSAKPKDHGHAEFIPGCMQATIDVQIWIDPMIEYYDAHAFNTCQQDAQVEGVAELWVEGRLVASEPLDSEGRARLQHLRGGFLSAKPACVIIRGEQHQRCDHKTNDTPGHLRHGETFPVHVESCRFPER